MLQGIRDRFRLLGIMLLATLGIATTGTARAGALDEIREKGVLRVAVYQDFAPYSYQEGGRYKGLDVDLARALAERLGVGLALMPITADESVEDDLRNAVWRGHYLGGGTADVMMHVPVDPRFAARNERVRIFAPYYQERIAIAHRQAEIADVASLEVFAEHKVGVELESVADRYLITTRGGALRANVVHFRSVDQACQALRQGQVPALMAQRAQLEHCVGAAAQEFAISAVPEPNVVLFTWSVGLAVKADAEDLRQALEAAFEQVRQQGRLQSIFDGNGLRYQPPAS
ncbi:MAG TPA: transporter substrate-binding domain-containing protein [Candidatus Competibacteraceae bacterium]|nr:transporter substrate-binding domain-containing protein [Candidatus Competibacteraceae bacterium]